MAETIGILSLKGGVGKTSSVVSLGAALANFGKRVLLVDGNFSAPNLGMHLNLLNPEKHITSVLEGAIHPKDAIYNLDDFDVLPANVNAPVAKNPLKLRDKLKSLESVYDYVLIDSSPSLNEETLAVMLASDRLFVVTTPDYPTLSMTLKAIKMAKKRGTEIQGIILNKVYNRNFELTLEDIENTAEIPILAVIPHDLNIPAAQSQFVPFLDYKPNSEGSDEYNRLAATLVGEKYSPIKLKTFVRWLIPKKQDINRTIFYKRVFDDEN